MRNYTVWLKTTAIFQFINVLIHTPTLFISPLPCNETEKQLFELMNTYRMDFGAGFHRTMNELTLVFSACLSLLCLFAGTMNWYLLGRKVGVSAMKGVVVLNVVTFGILFALTLMFTFVLPVVLIGLVFIFLVLSLISIYRKGQVN